MSPYRRALNVILSAQWIDANAFTTDIAGEHSEIGDRHDRGRALAVFGHAESVKNGAVATAGIQTRGSA